MLLDQNTMLSDGQEITASGASQNVVDLGAAGNAVPGSLFVVCRVEKAFAGLTKLEVVLQTADTEDFVTPVALSTIMPEATGFAKEGQTLFAVAVPAGLKRFVRAYYTVTGTVTAGELSCFLTDCVDMK